MELMLAAVWVWWQGWISKRGGTEEQETGMLGWSEGHLSVQDLVQGSGRGAEVERAQGAQATPGMRLGQCASC